MPEAGEAERDALDEVLIASVDPFETWASYQAAISVVQRLNTASWYRTPTREPWAVPRHGQDRTLRTGQQHPRPARNLRSRVCAALRIATQDAGRPRSGPTEAFGLTPVRRWPRSLFGCLVGRSALSGVVEFVPTPGFLRDAVGGSHRISAPNAIALRVHDVGGHRRLGARLVVHRRHGHSRTSDRLAVSTISGRTE